MSHPSAARPDAAGTRDAAATPGTKILVADDNQTNRLILRTMLERLGFAVTLTEDGREAVARYRLEQPDIVLMDIMMPGMNGYEAASEIKKISGERFVPVIFLTAITDEQALSKCIDCGGDDFLTKPYNVVILKAKIDALLRVSRLYQEIRRHKDEIERHHERLRREHLVADNIFSAIVHSGDLSAPHIKYRLSAQSITCGDILLAARTPAGGLNIMLGDFTGHGLAAAIGAVPTADTFYRMTESGYSIADIASGINQQLRQIFPTGYYCAAGLIACDAAFRTMTVWNGGVRDILVKSGRINLIKHRFPSTHLPLGVVDEAGFDKRVAFLEIDHGDRAYIYSDGVVEARNTDGGMFGTALLEQTILAPIDDDLVFDALCATLNGFCADAEQCDDIALAEILCVPLAAEHAGAPARAARGARPATEWCASLRLDGRTLRSVDPVPVIMQNLMALQGLHDHRERVYIVLSELFANALDHGLLHLDTGLKGTPQEFDDYYTQRGRRLAGLDDGWIEVTVRHRPRGLGGALEIEIADSGQGFDYRELPLELARNRGFGGRGIRLVQSLCTELRYHGNGNRVAASYIWGPDPARARR